MLTWWLPFVVLFATALVTTLLLTPVARRIAWKVGAVDYPSARRVNTTPTPRMGGIAVFCGIVVAELVQILGYRFFGWPRVLVPANHAGVNYALVFYSFAAIFVTGLIDDKFQLKPYQKLIGQVIAACLAVSSGMVIDVIVNPFHNTAINLGILAYPITVVYLVAYTNIFNLIDGLDGLASGIACIASLTMWVVSTISGHLGSAALAMMLAGATLGFLRYNFHPASIFLGDSGSLLIGFVLGSISLLSVSRVAGLTAIIIPLVVAGIPIIDTFSAIIRRGRAHVSIGHADRGHIHHRLLDEGFDQRETVVFIYIWTALLCVGAVVMTQVHVLARVLIFIALVIASSIMAVRLQLFQPVLLHHYDPKTGEDELVCPEDPEFKEEERRQVENHERFEGPTGGPEL